MRDDEVRLSVIGQIVRRRWPLLTLMMVAGALVGAGSSLVFSPGYESVSRVLLQGSWEKDGLQTEADIASSSVVLDRTATKLGWGVPGIVLRRSVTTELADGKIIEIRSVAKTAERAQQLTGRVAQEYAKFSTQLITAASNAQNQLSEAHRATLNQQVAENNKMIADMQSSAPPAAPDAAAQFRAQLERLHTAVADATSQLDGTTPDPQAKTADAASQAHIIIMEPATLPISPGAPTLPQLAAAGAVLFFVLGVLGHLVAARSDRRLRISSEIGAAFGAPIVGSVDVPEGRIRGVRARLRRLLHDDRSWEAQAPTTPADEVGRDIRYQRALGRIRDKSGVLPRLLIVVVEDDAVARRAVAHLAAASASSGWATALVTDRPDLGSMVQEACQEAGAVPVGVVSSSDPPPEVNRTVFHVVDVSVARPTVPDTRGVSGVMVVLTAGTRTGWEIVGISEACADAGLTVVGVLVAHRTSPVVSRKPARADSSGDPAMAGPA
jgi:capsular polysaccharide biosynthesis protein